MNIENDPMNSRHLDVHRASNYPEVKLIVDYVFCHIKKVYGKRIVSTFQFNKHLKVILLDLWVNYQSDPNRYTGVSLDRNNYTKGTRYNLLFLKYKHVKIAVEMLIELGYIDFIKGVHITEGLRFTSRIRATEKLIQLLDGNECQSSDKRSDGVPKVFHGIFPYMVERVTNEEIILLKGRDDDNNKILIDYPNTAGINKMRSNLKHINRAISNCYLNLHISDAEHAVMNDILNHKPDRLPVDFLRIRLRRIFSNGVFTQGGRFYHGWWMEIPKQYRKFITIDGNYVIELDYSSMHIVMLYAQAGLQLTEDPYQVPSFDPSQRSNIKTVLQTMINAKSRTKAVGGINKRIDEGELPELYRNNTDVIDALAHKHEPIAEYINSGEGVKLQYKDSVIAERVMLTLLDMGIVALPVHDSFIVQSQHIDILREEMSKAFSETIFADAGIDTKDSIYNSLEIAHLEEEPGNGQPVDVALSPADVEFMAKDDEDYRQAYSLYFQRENNWLMSQRRGMKKYRIK